MSLRRLDEAQHDAQQRPNELEDAGFFGMAHCSAPATDGGGLELVSENDIVLEDE